MLKFVGSALALVLAVPAVAQVSTPTPAPAGGSVSTYIHAGQLLDRPGKPPRGRSTIVVRDGRVVEVRDGFVAPPAGAKLVDLSSRFVLPGLTDMHVHLWGIGGDPMRARLAETTQDQADDMMVAVVNARRTLEAGFTTVRDLGGDARGIRALRDAVERGDVEGPTIVNAGQMISVTGTAPTAWARASPTRSTRTRSTSATAPMIAAAR